MSLKWTGRSESGILRKNDPKEKKEELFVFGYSCKLFRDDPKALLIDQGKHLIPWMGDDTLKIDRYDARGALHDLTGVEAPQGGYDWRVELTRTELDVEQLCDEERYRALHTDEDEEEMYKEEELKRLHKAGYGQVGFNYDTPAEPAAPTQQPTEVDELFEPTDTFKALFSQDILMPETLKQNAIIEKTAKFIASQGAQMEILIKAKQGDNPQFKFLNKDSTLNPYYAALITLIKAGKWPEKPPEPVEEKPQENEDYLHPSLASTVVEAAPVIPWVVYRESAECDYRLLVSRVRDAASPEPAPGEEPPPGTRPLPPPAAPPEQSTTAKEPATAKQDSPQYASYYQQYLAQQQQAQSTQQQPTQPNNNVPIKSTGLSLMKNYNTDSDSDASDSGSCSDDPPEGVRAVAGKMAAYVRRNGPAFADVVRARRDPRFAFLDPAHPHHRYYLRLLRPRHHHAKSAPVSFSIKKLKEPDPVLPKPALPYESSSEDEQKEKEKEKPEEKEPPTPTIPPPVVYRVEAQAQPIVKEPPVLKPIPNIIEIKDDPVIQDKPKPERVKDKTPPPEKREKSRDIDREREVYKEYKEYKEYKKDRKKRDRKEYRSKSKDRSEKGSDRDKRREKENDRDKKREEKKPSKDDLESEIISLEDNSDDLIDLTDDNDTKAPAGDAAKQQARRARAAQFLQRVTAAPLPHSSLHSAMVDTLETLRKKKEEEEEKRRRREKKRHRHDYDSERHRRSKHKRHRSGDDDSEHDSSKKKKKRKDKKHSKNKKRRREEVEEEEEPPIEINIDLTNTLKELRNSSPTKDLVQDLISKDIDVHVARDSSDEEMEDRPRRKKKEREYSEGEWSSDSGSDSSK